MPDGDNFPLREINEEDNIRIVPWISQAIADARRQNRQLLAYMLEMALYQAYDDAKRKRKPSRQR